MGDGYMQSKIFKIVNMTLCIPMILFLLNGCNLNKSDSIETTVDAKVIENDLDNKQLIIHQFRKLEISALLVARILRFLISQEKRCLRITLGWMM